jgi:dUTP pyrophosphatase
MFHPDQEARASQLEKISNTKALLNKIKNISLLPDTGTKKVRVTRSHQEAKIPTKSNLSDAGWDLYSIEDTEIYEGKRKIIRTGISLQIPDGFVGLIWPRSGMSVKHGVDVLAGVIDSGYRGEIMVCLYNTNTESEIGHNSVKIKRGDRIAQILFQEVPEVMMVEVEDLSSSDRGDKGFGSSGK